MPARLAAVESAGPPTRPRLLLGLIFRGVAFEFRFKADDAHRPWWDKAFIGGSLVATFFQGATLGGFLQGIRVVDRAYAGNAFDWFTPFSLFTGVGLVVAYALPGPGRGRTRFRRGPLGRRQCPPNRGSRSGCHPVCPTQILSCR